MSIDSDHTKKITDHLAYLLDVPSPVGACAPIANHVYQTLLKYGWFVEELANGNILARWPSAQDQSGEELVFASHLDTLGAQVCSILPNGRLSLIPVGTWSSRFAEGARVKVLGDKKMVSGTILPAKSSGHAYDDAVDTQPVTWSNLQVRLDECVASCEETQALGVQVGDLVSINPQPEFLENGFIVSRHLDDKAAVAVLLYCAENISNGVVKPVRPVTFAFSVREEVGAGASAFAGMIHGDIVAIDIGIVADEHTSNEESIAVCMGDSGGPHHRAMSIWVENVCHQAEIECGRDVFRHYFSDTTAIADAGGSQRMALLTFGVDASHGYERTHINSLLALHRAIHALCEAEPL